MAKNKRMARKHHLLYGLMFRPSAANQEEYEKYIFSADYSVKEDFRKAYQDHMAAMQIVGMSAKIYVLNNWKKVKDWKDMEISIVDSSGKETYYFNYKERMAKLESVRSNSKAFARLDRYRKGLHNPIKKISDVVLDVSDGDFSVKINGKWHNWIDDESVIVLADYIEKKNK